MTPDFDVRACRKRLHLTQPALAKLLGTTERSIRRWEKGMVKHGVWRMVRPRKGDIQKMKDFLQLQAAGEMPSFAERPVAHIGILPSSF